MKARRWIGIGLALGLLIPLGFWLWSSVQPPAVSAEITSLQAVTSGAGFAQVTGPRAWQFPQDHGPHPEYQTEWWYYTGNLEAADGRHFGYQLTFFRRGLTPAMAPGRTSDWATNQIYFAHFAITDVTRNNHWATERFSRGAAGLAGASGDPYRVWLEDWTVTSLTTNGERVHLAAREGPNALDLTLSAAKPPVLQGEGGVSRKSAAPGNASYYVSFTRLDTEGQVTANGAAATVRGVSWMDHEFGTTELGPNATGWDWFSIQLSDRREVMFFLVRLKDGGVEPLSSGTLVEPDGSTRRLARDELGVQVLETWKSASGGAYPARWKLSAPSANLDLELTPYVADQEMRLSFTYWEGAVKIVGTSNGASVAGSGYVELTGYAGAGGVGYGAR